MKKGLAIILIGAMLLSGLPLWAQVAVPEGYTAISNETELRAIENNLAGNYVLTNDIILTESFSPLAPDEDTPFTGTLDGAGYMISGLQTKVQVSGTAVAGLFGYNAGVIIGLALKEVKIQAAGADPYGNAYTYAGAFAAFNAGTIQKCSVSGMIEGNSGSLTAFAGGIIGENTGTVDRCSSYADVSALGTSEAVAGGICGQNKGTITNCYSVKSITAKGASVNTDCILGGIAGKNGWAGSGEIRFCYSRSTFLTDAQEPFVGGVSGNNLNLIRDSYYDKAAAAAAIGGSADQTGALSDEELQKRESFPLFGFAEIWMIKDYPALQDVRNMTDIILGDVGGDGIAEMSDVVLLMNVLVGNTDFHTKLEAADMNEDQRISISDVVFLLKKLAGFN